MVQWLRLHAYDVGAMGLIPVQRNSACLVAWPKRDQKKKKLLPWWSGVQWLRIHLLMQGCSPWFGKIPHASGQLSPCITTTEARWPQSLCSATREATAGRSAPQPEGRRHLL